MTNSTPEIDVMLRNREPNYIGYGTLKADGDKTADEVAAKVGGAILNTPRSLTPDQQDIASLSGL